MIKFRTRLNIFLGRIRYLLAKIRRCFQEVCVLAPGHWKWAAYSMLLIIVFFMVGMAIDFVGELHIGIFLAAPIVATIKDVGLYIFRKLLDQDPWIEQEEEPIPVEYPWFRWSRQFKSWLEGYRQRKKEKSE